MEQGYIQEVEKHIISRETYKEQRHIWRMKTHKEEIYIEWGHK